MGDELNIRRIYPPPGKSSDGAGGRAPPKHKGKNRPRREVPPVPDPSPVRESHEAPAPPRPAPRIASRSGDSVNGWNALVLVWLVATLSVPIVAGGRTSSVSLIIAAISLCGLAACVYLRRRMIILSTAQSDYVDEVNRLHTQRQAQAVDNRELSTRLEKQSDEIADLRGRLEGQADVIADLRGRLDIQPEPSPELVERLAKQDEAIADMRARLEDRPNPPPELIDRLEKIEQQLEGQETALAQLKHEVEKKEEVIEPQEMPQQPDTIDLGDMGTQDLSRLTAATMDRSVFPRLAAALDEARQSREASEPAAAAIPPGLNAANDLLTRNIYREWELARRANDLRTCRRLYAAFVDAWEPATAVAYRTELEALSLRVEEKLREAFRQHIHEADYAAAIEIGDEICELFPEFPIAAEYERIRPYLARRVV